MCQVYESLGLIYFGYGASPPWRFKTMPQHGQGLQGNARQAYSLLHAASCSCSCTNIVLASIYARVCYQKTQKMLRLPGKKKKKKKNLGFVSMTDWK